MCPVLSNKYRMRFSKEGKAIYMSHLDLMRTMQRAFFRAGLSLKHSEGFNPHAQISILVPLSVGMKSRCELMDFTLTEAGDCNAMVARLNQCLPEGVHVSSIYQSDRKVRELQWLSVVGELSYDAGCMDEKIQALEAFFSQQTIMIMKKTKRGIKETDIALGLHQVEFVRGTQHVLMTGILSAQEPTLSPEHMMQALRQNQAALAPDFAVFTRMETLDVAMQPFR